MTLRGMHDYGQWKDAMPGTVTLCFDLPTDAMRDIEEAARANDVTPRELMAEIAGEFLAAYREGRAATFGSVERRRHRRRAVDIPAVLLVKFFDNETRCYPGRIRDLSLGGVQVSFDEKNEWQRRQLENVVGFEIVFTVPGTSSTVSFQCRTCRAQAEEDVRLAARFEEANSEAIHEVGQFMQ